MNEIGQAINDMFVAQSEWVYSNGIIFITGRDIIGILLGFLLGVVVTSSVAVYLSVRRTRDVD